MAHFLLFLLPLLPLCLAAVEDTPVKAQLVLNNHGKYAVIKNPVDFTPDWLVKGEYKNAVNKTGWAFVDIASNPAHPDKQQAYGAGYLEGYLTSEVLLMHYQNSIVGRCDGKQELCDKINNWLDDNLAWVARKTKFHSKERAYWHQVSLFMIQLTGIVEGYNAAMKGRDPITMADILTMNVFGDLEDLESAFGDKDQLSSVVMGNGHCSALIRTLPGNSDLLVSHDTWNTYQTMIRLIKKYTLPYKKSLSSQETVPGHTMSFSGYPGVIFSGDDFTIASTGLTILETTIGNSNPELWSKLKPQSMLEGIRATVANRLAVDGKSWTDIFAIHNSGTYNNQWMVVNYNLFEAGAAELPADLVWVLEQIPGYTRAADVTPVISKQGYWPSYNSPYFTDVFNMSGNFKLMKQYGDWFSYDRTPRANIFRRDAPKVTDIESMIKLMRYNDFTKDPLSACDQCSPPYSAENAISARNDLNPKNGTYPFPALSHRSHGATDMKMTSAGLAKEFGMIVQGGPTFDPLPPFRWSEQDFKDDTPHVGHPDLWQFEPITVTWN